MLVLLVGCMVKAVVVARTLRAKQLLVLVAQGQMALLSLRFMYSM
jgi:hypothetical protein